MTWCQCANSFSQAAGKMSCYSARKIYATDFDHHGAVTNDHDDFANPSELCYSVKSEWWNNGNENHTDSKCSTAMLSKFSVIARFPNMFVSSLCVRCCSINCSSLSSWASSRLAEAELDTAIIVSPSSTKSLVTLVISVAINASLSTFARNRLCLVRLNKPLNKRSGALNGVEWIPTRLPKHDMYLFRVSFRRIPQILQNLFF